MSEEERLFDQYAFMPGIDCRTADPRHQQPQYEHAYENGPGWSLHNAPPLLKDGVVEWPAFKILYTLMGLPYEAAINKVNEGCYIRYRADLQRDGERN